MGSPGMKKGIPRVLTVALFLSLFLTFTASAIAALPWEEGNDTSLHAQCWSFGASIGRVEGLSGALARLAGPDDRAIILEGTQNDYLTPYTSEEFQISVYLLNNFTILQGAYGMRWSTVPFPKVFLRPWVGAYLTLNFLEDDRDINAEDEEFDGIGIGLAASMGVTMRLSRSVALEAAVRGDQVFIFGRLESDDFFSDEFKMRGAYLRLLYFFKD